jgi:hypothetical protein
VRAGAGRLRAATLVAMPAGPATPSLRASVERTTRPLLLRLHGLPRPVIPLATLALVAVGVLAPPAVGLVALAVVALFVLWISYLSWPVVSGSGRAVRAVMVALVVVLALTRL